MPGIFFYELLRIGNGGDASKLVGLKIFAGRFGNMMQQYTNAVLLAERTGLKYIQLGRCDIIDPKKPVSAGGITFLPVDAPLPEGTFLVGNFLDTLSFLPVLSPFFKFLADDEKDHSRVAREIIRPNILTGIKLLKEHCEDEVTIHLRSGDVFQTGEDVSWFRQPPLSFYKLVLERLSQSGRIKRACLVFEDRGNPCVDALEAFLMERKIPVRIQSSTLAEDLATLIDAPHLVFGLGTFGYSVCRLSKHIKTLHYFSPEFGGRYKLIPGIDEVVEVFDREGSYFKAIELGKTFGEGPWRNTPEQRRIMLDYPIRNLGVRD